MKSVYFALKQIVPLLFSYVFVGIAYGILLHQAGYSAVWTFLSSAFIYAGSMQIVMVSLMTSGVSLITIAVMTFFINARHIFYGIGFVERFRKMGWKYPYMVLTMTDETYSVLCSVQYPEGVEEEKADFYIQFFCHILWILSCMIGTLAGEFLPFDMTGITFSATAFFIVVVVNQWIQFKSHIPAITGLISAFVFYILFGADKFIIPALSVSMIVLIGMKDYIIKKTGDENHEN